MIVWNLTVIHLDVQSTSKNETWLTSIEQLLGVAESPERDYNFFRDRWTAGTCTWILGDPGFVEWLHDTQDNPRILWIQGNAASGKSILSSFVIDHLIQNGRLCQYFFVRFEDKKKRSLSTMLRSLACQIARTLPTYAARIRQLEAAGSDLKSIDYRHIWQLMYKQSLFDLEAPYPLYWVLDGIEEADNPQLLFNILSELHSIHTPLRILLVSRRTHEITTAAQKLSKQIDIRQISIDGNEDDFRRYVDREMDPVGEDSYREQVITEILRRAQGNFLWVHLAVQKINECQTRMEVEDALKELPTGMETLYHRMASTIKAQPEGQDPTLGQRILSWATYAQRPLSAEELSDALGIDGLLEIHRTIGQLCGGFVVVDHDGRVALIHETAREYLIRGQHEGVSLGLERKAANDKLFKRCITRLMDPTLRNLINRDRTPALLDYATSALFFHLSHGSPLNWEKLSDLLRFFQNQHVLTWIHVAAKGKKLRSLVVASRYLNEIVLKLRNMNEQESLLHRQVIEVLTGWAADLVKLVGKFGASLLKKPDAIYKLVPPFCPENSIIYQQFGKNEVKALRVSGITRSSWDDCLARLSLEQGVMASAVHHAGGRIVVLANRQNSGRIFIYNSTTFEEERRILHPERVFKIQADSIGEHLVSYGYRSTRVWTMSNGECIKTVDNPRKRPRPQSVLYVEKTREVLVAGEDRCIRSVNIDDDSTEWQSVVKIEEQSQEETYTVLNAPTCSALSPEGDMIAFGYRGHPVTVWDLGTEEQVGQCNMTPDETGVTTQTRTLGEITALRWHPFNCEIFGLHREGLMFKWDPYDDEASATMHARAHFLAISADGSLVATGDTEGTLKVYTTADLTLVYQLSSQDHVLDIAFSADSKRLYDIRGDYGNVWEPNALVRLAESSEYSDHNTSDAWSENESLAKLSLQTEHHFPGVDTIVSLCGQMSGPLYCYGTENGVAVLGEVGHGNVCEVERMANFMSIEQVSWSDDGQILAVADLSERISIKRISKTTSTEGQRPLRVHDEFKVAFPSTHRHINQLLFQPKTHNLLAISSIGLFNIDADTQKVEESSLPVEMADVKWISHPTQSEYLLAFGHSHVRIFSWSTLKEVATYHYSPPRLRRSTEVPENQHGRGSFRAGEEKLGRIVSCTDSPDVILEIALPTPSAQPERQYLIFTLSNTDGVSDEAVASSPEQQTKELCYTLVPPEIACRIREPLALISRGRFVFLDVDRWICTWRTPTAPRRSVGGRAGSEAGLVGPVDAHYFLPGDWVTAIEARLCTVAPDGTLLCPRNGDVASVQCAKLRK
jgi:WD40 repeat protein